MKILNCNLERDLISGSAIKIELGSGGKRRPGFYGIDILELDGVDVVADLNKPLSAFPNNCCDYVYTSHSLEHIVEFAQLMKEIHRVTKPGGTVEIVVPHFSNVYGYSDPTHVRFFGLYTMYYFVDKCNQPKVRSVPVFYTDTRFKLDLVRIEFYRASFFDRLIYPFLKTLVNINMNTKDIYERRISRILHARQIRYILRPEK